MEKKKRNWFWWITWIWEAFDRSEPRLSKPKGMPGHRNPPVPPPIAGAPTIELARLRHKRNRHRPFTPDEKMVVDALLEAHNAFLRLPRSHNHELGEWIHSFHRLQDLMGFRVLQRDYPDFFVQPDQSNNGDANG